MKVLDMTLSMTLDTKLKISVYPLSHGETMLVGSVSEWKEFFNSNCPKYEFGDKIYRSKKDWYNNPDFTTEYGFEPDSFPHEKDEWWQTINRSNVDIETQKVAEELYDLYNQ